MDAGTVVQPTNYAPESDGKHRITHIPIFLVLLPLL
jgi:hypothetical protein